MTRALEERRQPYLFKLKLSKNVKRHIGRLFRENGWVDAGQGWEGRDSALALADWTHPRRIIVLRCPIREEMLVTGEDNGQHWPASAHAVALKLSRRERLTAFFRFIP